MRNTSGPGRKIGITWIVLLIIGVIFSVSAGAAVLNWNAAGGNWSDSANWTPTGVPDSADDVVVFTKILPALTSTNNFAALSITSVTNKDGIITLDLSGNSLTCRTFAVNGLGVGTNADVTITNSGRLIIIGTNSIGRGAVAADARLTLSPESILQVGLSTNNRALLLVGSNTGGNPTPNTAYLVCGKIFNAFLSHLYVGNYSGYNTANTYGLLDLSAATNQGVLDVAGNLWVGADDDQNYGEVIVPNSIDVKIGMAVKRGGDLLVGCGQNVTIQSRLSLGTGRFDAYVTNVVLGSSGANGLLDAQNASGGVLDILTSLVVGGSGSSKGYLYLGNNVDLKLGSPTVRADKLVVGVSATTSTVVLGTGRFEAYVTNVWVGNNSGFGIKVALIDAANISDGVLNVSARLSVALDRNTSGGSATMTLSDHFTTTIGAPGQRAVMTVAAGGLTQIGRVTAGGVFNAYLTTLSVGTNATGDSTNPSNGLLDLSKVTNGTMDVSDTIRIGGGGAYGIGEVRLPAIPAAAGTLLVGATTTGSKGTLIMTGTVFTVTNSVVIDGPVAAGVNTGRVSVTVAGAPAGLNLAAITTLTVNKGRIEITFKDLGDRVPIYWGLRWEGDHVAELTALQAASKLVWNDSAIVNPMIKEPVSIFVEGGVTYVGVPVAPVGSLLKVF